MVTLNARLRSAHYETLPTHSTGDRPVRASFELAYANNREADGCTKARSAAPNVDQCDQVCLQRRGGSEDSGYQQKRYLQCDQREGVASREAR